MSAEVTKHHTDDKHSLFLPEDEPIKKIIQMIRSPPFKLTHENKTLPIRTKNRRALEQYNGKNEQREHDFEVRGSKVRLIS